MPTATIIDKTASADYDIHELIKNRWSPRAFADKPVESELLRQLFDAARLAPSAYNEQPWRFIMATKDQPDEFEQLSRVIAEKNQQWANHAPVLILTVVKDQFDMNGLLNKHAQHDLGQAISYLTLEAMRHNIYVHQMAGILPGKAREMYAIPEGFTPLTMVALGYPGHHEQLPEAFREMETAKRNRRAIDELVFRGEWNNSQPI